MAPVEGFQDPDIISYLRQQEAAEIDEILMGPLGFSVDQLIELAGLSVATAIAEVYKSNEHNRVLAICGPGNNGGEGLVAARHLYHLGFKPYVCYPNQTPKPLYNGLVAQLKSLSVPFLSVDDLPVDLPGSFDILVDAVFGFSFHGAPSPPFDYLIRRMANLSNPDARPPKSTAIISVDIPSGWHAEGGDLSGDGIKPDMLVSLTAPKLCAKFFSGPHHFLGGRFVPPSIIQKFKLQLPAYPGTSMCVRIERPPKIDPSAKGENYSSPEFLEEQLQADPFDQFQKWYDDTVAAGVELPIVMSLSTASGDKKPSSRVVLLESFNKEGFVWYANKRSRKGRQVSENPYAAMLFCWGSSFRQIHIEGPVEEISEAEAEQYFAIRPPGIQIGAIAFDQSSVVPNRQAFEQPYKDLEAKYSTGGSIPKPEHWRGFRVKPEYFEFWQGHPSHLHDRFRYTPLEIDGKKVWKIDRLAP